MSSIFALSISTAVLCGIWSLLSGVTGLIAWVGFAGCTTYFANGKYGMIGVKKAIVTNIAGVCCGMMIIKLSNLIPILGKMGVWCAILTFVMCMIAKYEWFDFCPGTFIGCFTTFAAGGEWFYLIISLVVGAFLGLACEYGGVLIYNKVKRKE